MALSRRAEATSRLRESALAIDRPSTGHSRDPPSAIAARPHGGRCAAGPSPSGRHRPRELADGSARNTRPRTIRGAAFGSICVMGTAFATGHAAGLSAVFSAGGSPHRGSGCAGASFRRMRSSSCRQRSRGSGIPSTPVITPRATVASSSRADGMRQILRSRRNSAMRHLPTSKSSRRKSTRRAKPGRMVDDQLGRARLLVAYCQKSLGPGRFILLVRVITVAAAIITAIPKRLTATWTAIVSENSVRMTEPKNDNNTLKQ
jgi:hypothetical protein